MAEIRPIVTLESGPPPTNDEVAVLPLELGSNSAQKVIALTALLALCYFGKVILATIMFAVLLAFVLEPLVELLERIRLPRPAGALLGLLIFTGALYAMTYLSFVRATSFIQELPKYTEQVKGTVLKFRKQAQQLQKTTQAIAPSEEKAAIPVKQVGSPWAGLTTTAGSLSETLLVLTFIPVLAYFMVTWRDHMRASAVKLFGSEDRTTAYVALGRVAKMLRAFIVGNLVIGLIMGGMSVLAFWWAGVPYFYFLGFISGFLSLVPYLGVAVALLPPLVAGVGVLTLTNMVVVVVAVLLIHLFSFNVIYPKLMGARMQLNPLIVTVSLLFWAIMWGPMGLILAVPITAAMKVVCDHVDSLRGLGELMGEGRKA